MPKKRFDLYRLDFEAQQLSQVARELKRRECLECARLAGGTCVMISSDDPISYLEDVLILSVMEKRNTRQAAPRP
jgi:hypothetical protein